MPATAPSGIETPGRAVLGKSVVVKGEIHSREALTIEGEVEGSIEMGGQRLTVAPDGNVRASVKARDIDVLGSVEGCIEAAEKVYIRKGAHFLGDIHSGSIVIEDGGYIKGSVDLSEQAGAAPAAL